MIRYYVRTLYILYIIFLNTGPVSVIRQTVFLNSLVSLIRLAVFFTPCPVSVIRPLSPTKQDQ